MRRILPQYAVLHTVKSIEHIAQVTLGIPGTSEFGYGTSPWGLFPWGAPTIPYMNQLFCIWHTNYPKVTTPEGVMTFLFPYRTYPDHPAQPRNSRYWLFDTVTPQGID
ncbi:hypothetical protein, partial [Candidatus Caldatribacterium sp.]|uniref:hypothetical protein n=1 Tax=Candidatus Caldatribacterium sp. TaxID=2282143 RepID=UPI0038456306|nr:hypothetical protein [Candidatus Caldatribacterium sp.]